MNSRRGRSIAVIPILPLFISTMLLLAGCGGQASKGNQRTWEFDTASDLAFDSQLISVNEEGDSLAKLKRLPDGAFWTATYKDPRPLSGPEYHVIDFCPDGSIVAVGDYADFSDWSSQVIVGKYDPNGQAIPGWPKFYSSPGRHWNEGQDVKVDDAGNITVAGYATIWRLDPNGNPLAGWPQSFLGDDSIGTGVIIDAGGDIVVCGTPDKDVNGLIALKKFRPDGGTAEGWPKFYGVPGAKQNFSYDIFRDSGGNLILSGYTQVAGNRDAILYKLDADGNVLPGWPKVWDSGAPFDEYFSLSQEANGDYCVVGVSGNTAREGKLLVTRYSVGGDQLTSSGWPQVYDKSGPRDASPPDSWSGSVDSTGSIAAAAVCQPDTRVTTVKYSRDATMASGFPKVLEREGYYQVTRSCTVDDLNNIYTVGYWEVGDGSHADYTSFIVKYPPGAYSTASPSVVTVTGIEYTRLTGFTERLGPENQGRVVYQLSPDGTRWYYHDGSRWVPATAARQANSADEMNGHLESFSGEFGHGKLYLKAFLVSDGSQKVQLDSFTVTFE